MKPFVLVPVVLLVSLAACALITEPRQELPPAELPVEMQAASLPEMPDAFSVAGSEGAVIVRDRAITGVCHRHENHGAYLDGDEVVFWIAHTGRLRTPCQDIGLLRPYEARIGGLEPGEYGVRVDYIGEIDTDSYPRPDLRATVTVR